jgi:hypothetical protein
MKTLAILAAGTAFPGAGYDGARPFGRALMMRI